MHGRTWMRWWMVTLPGLVLLGGCVASGRPLPALRDQEASRLLARAGDIPLVPVPPPPLGRGQDTPVAPAPVPTPAPVPVPAPIATATPAVGSGRGPVEATPTANRLPGAQPAAASAEVVVPPAATAGSSVRQIYQAARDRYAGIDSYIVRLVRREMVKERMQPEELILFRYRKNPWSAHLKWLGKEGQGREVVYVQGRHDDKIHSLLASGDIPFVPAGKRMALSPDNVLVRSAARHPITEAGIGANIDRIGRTLDTLDRGDRRVGSLTVVGPVSRPEFGRPIIGIEHQLPPGADPTLPRGGKRTTYFHPDTSLPMLLTTQDERGQEVEYYRYDRLQESVRLDDRDFDPDLMWGKPAAAR